MSHLIPIDPHDVQLSGVLEAHPYAGIFPLLGEAALGRLSADVEEHGLQEPIVIYQGLVLDGRNRLAACLLLGQSAPAVELCNATDAEALAYVISLNLHRRHLDTGQKSIAANRIRVIYEAQAKERQGTRTDLDPNLQATLPEGVAPQARDDAGAAVGVGGRNVDKARTVLKDGAPSLVDALAAGGVVSVDAALEISKLPQDVQDDVIALDRKLRTAKEIKRIVKMTPEDQAAVVDRLKSGASNNTRQAVKHLTADKIDAEPAPLPTGPFRVIVADPPWRYDVRQDDATHRSITYPMMDTADICALDVEALAHPDAVLWLWTTNAHMEEAHQVARAWGFETKTILTWVKDRIGLGHWLRGQTEHVLLCVRGTPTVLGEGTPTYFEARKGDHSVKPDEFYAIVEDICPGSKVELFSRTSREGWAAWGGEAGALDGDA